MANIFRFWWLAEYAGECQNLNTSESKCISVFVGQLFHFATLKLKFEYLLIYQNISIIELYDLIYKKSSQYIGHNQQSKNNFNYKGINNDL